MSQPDKAITANIPVTYRNYVYRLKVRPVERERLAQLLEMQRLLYNAALQERVDAYRKAGKSIRFFDQCKSLTQIRADDPAGYGALPVNLGRGTLAVLDRAMQSFFRRVKSGDTAGFPRFRSMSRWSSLSFKEMSGLKLSKTCTSLTFAGLDGFIRIRRHRPLPEGAVPKAAVIRETALGWELSLLMAIPMHSPEAWLPLEENDKPDMGIDVGIESFLTTSEGEQLAPINANRHRAAERRRLQRSLSRKQKGSARRRSARQRLARHSAHEGLFRKDHAHKVSANLAKRYRCMVVEDLKIKTLSRSAKGTADQPGKNVKQRSGLNRSLLDQGWGDFIFKLTYKAENAGGKVIQVNPRGTSQLCSGCGVIVEKKLSQRTHVCPSCGLNLHRDHNAARNILFRAAREGKIPARLQLMVSKTECRENSALILTPPNAQFASDQRSVLLVPVSK